MDMDQALPRLGSGRDGGRGMKATFEQIEALRRALDGIAQLSIGEAGEALNAALSASPAPAVPVEPVAWGAFRDGQMVAWIPGANLEDAFLPEKGADEYRPLYATPPAPAVGDGSERVRHKKRGSTYQVIGRGRLQVDEDLDNEKITVYRGEADGLIWVRPDYEFNDGRFEQLAASPATDLREENKRLKAELEELQERVHYAEGTADANIQRATTVEARLEKAREALDAIKANNLSGDEFVVGGPGLALARLRSCANIASATLQELEGRG